MATRTFTIESYEVTLSRKMTYLGGEYYGIIVCHGGGYRMGIYFMTPTSMQPDNIANTDARWATIFLPGELFLWYLNILQNEKPVYAYMNTNKPEWNRLYTGREPVGEEES